MISTRLRFHILAYRISPITRQICALECKRASLSFWADVSWESPICPTAMKKSNSSPLQSVTVLLFAFIIPLLRPIRERTYPSLNPTSKQYDHLKIRTLTHADGNPPSILVLPVVVERLVWAVFHRRNNASIDYFCSRKWSRSHTEALNASLTLAFREKAPPRRHLLPIQIPHL